GGETAVGEIRVVPGVEDVVVPRREIAVLERLVPFERVAVLVEIFEAAVGEQVRGDRVGGGQLRGADPDTAGFALVTDRDHHGGGQGDAGLGNLRGFLRVFCCNDASGFEPVGGGERDADVM